MFKGLRDKLKGWISKSKEETEEQVVETPQEEKKEEVKKESKEPKKEAKEERKEKPKKEAKEKKKPEEKKQKEKKDKEEKEEPKKTDEEGTIEEIDALLEHDTLDWEKEKKEAKQKEEEVDVKKKEKKEQEEEISEKELDKIEEKLQEEVKKDEYKEAQTEFKISHLSTQPDVEEIEEKTKEPKDKEEKAVQEEEPQEQEKEEDTKPEEKKKGFFASLFGKKEEKTKKEKEEADDEKEETVEDEEPPKEEPVTENIEPEKPKEEIAEEKEPTKETLTETEPEPEKKQEEKETPEEEVVEKTEEKKSAGFSLFKRKTLTEEKFDELFDELELILLQNNVAYEAIENIKSSLREKLVGDNAKTDIATALKESIEELLINPPNLIEQVEEKKKEGKPFIMLFAGINGAGKTTTIAKVAHLLKKHNFSCCLASADTFRAAAIEQLQVHADRLDVPLVKKDYGADPASVGFDAVKYAEKNNIDVVLIDTAGRMNNRDSLMKEIEKIVRVNNPDLKIFLGESTTGNDATQQAKDFNDAIDIDGIILSKADVDEKGGTAISVAQVTGKPIYFLGTGQTYDDLEVFDKSTLVNNIFGE